MTGCPITAGSQSFPTLWLSASRYDEFLYGSHCDPFVKVLLCSCEQVVMPVAYPGIRKKRERPRAVLYVSVLKEVVQAHGSAAIGTEEEDSHVGLYISPAYLCRLRS